MAALLFAALVFCLVRNNGIYILVISLVTVLAFEKRNRWIFLVLLLVPIALTVLYTGPIETSLGIYKGSGLREMLSIPAQQVARVYSYDQAILSDNQVEEILRFESEKGMSTYTQNQ